MKIVLALTIALIAHSASAQTEKPSYCSGAGAYRLSECGLTEKQAREAEAAAAASRSAARSEGREDPEIFFKRLSKRLKRRCDDRAVGSMSLDDIETCSSPSIRALKDNY